MRSLGRSRRRGGQALEMQQQALVLLLVASVVVFLVVLFAAYFTIAPLGTHSPRAVAPVLGAFMRAGAAQNARIAHTLLSVSGIRRYEVSDVAALFAQRELFEGFERLQVRSMRMLPPDGPVDPERAVVEASVRYEALPPARLRATLSLEEGDWRIETVEISRAER